MTTSLSDSFVFEQTLLGADGCPRVFYKGAPAGLTAFRINPHSGLVHVAPNERQAGQFQGDGAIYRVVVSAGNVFDARDPSSRAALVASLSRAQILQQLKEHCHLGTAIEVNGAEDVLHTFFIGLEDALYQSMELPCVVDWIRAQDYEGFWVHEDDGDTAPNLALFDAGKILHLQGPPNLDRSALDPRIGRMADLDRLRLSPRANDLEAQLRWSSERAQLAKQLALEVAAAENFSGLSLPHGSGHVGVHPSTKSPGVWQLTHFDENWVPMGDTGPKPVLQALKELFDESRPERLLSLSPAEMAGESPGLG